jgi:hypothetical protein
MMSRSLLGYQIGAALAGGQRTLHDPRGIRQYLFGCVLNPVLFDRLSAQPNYNQLGAREIISCGGNANYGDAGFPFNRGEPN